MASAYTVKLLLTLAHECGPPKVHMNLHGLPELVKYCW